MTVNLKRLTVGVLAGMGLIVTTLPAASQEPDEPENYEPPSPTTEDGTGDQDTTAGNSVGANSVTFDDFVRVTNPSGSGDAEIRLDGSAGDGSTQWDIENDATAGNQLQFLHGFGTSQMVLTPGGFLGLGTTTPQDPFHIANTGNDHILLEDTDGASFNLEAGGDFFDIDSTDFPLNNFRIHRDAPSNALVVRNGVGIGTASPLEALDVRNVTGSDVTRIRLANGAESWSNGLVPAGNYQFTKFGTGGAEFLVKERNNPVATIDVMGPVRATTFNTSSSSKFKTGAKEVDPLAILSSLNALPVKTWQFKACKNGEGRLPNDDGSPARPCSGKGTGPTHIGPMAEDFRAKFGLGDGESISTVDADGVMMASIQALTQLLENKDAHISELEDKVAQIPELEDKLSDLESRLTALEAQGGNDAPRGKSGK